MVILLAIPTIVITLILMIVFLFRHKWKTSLLLLVAAVTINDLTQQIPISFFRINSGWEMFSILEYNICAKKEYETRHGDEFIRYIVNQNADLLVLPENSIYRNNKLDSVLIVHYPYNLYSCMDKGRPEITSLFSKFPLSDIERMKDPLTGGLSQLNLKAVVDVYGTKITLFCIHAASNGDGVLNGYQGRAKEVDVLISEIRKRDTPDFIVCGDFNDLSGSKYIRAIQKENARDAWWNRGTGFGFTYKDGIKRFRLDHILLTPGIIVNRIDVDRDVDFSDHRPLITKLSIKR